MIDSYLKQSSELDDHAIHLLFAVNRWEKASVSPLLAILHDGPLTLLLVPFCGPSKSILEDLKQGTTVVCDRYAFSGAAFSAAKVCFPALSFPP